MARDPLAAHVRDELGLTAELAARPLQAALSSAFSFAVGSCLPLLVIILAPRLTPHVCWRRTGASRVWGPPQVNLGTLYGGAIHRTTLRFLDNGSEQDFQGEYFSKGFFQVRYCALLGAGIPLLFGFVAAGFPHSGVPRFFPLAIDVVVCALLVAHFFWTRTDAFRRHPQGWTAVGVSYAAAGIIAALITMPGFRDLIHLAMMIEIMAVLTLVRLRFVNGLAVTSLIVGSYLLVTVSITDTPFGRLYLLSSFFGSAIIVERWRHIPWSTSRGGTFCNGVPLTTREHDPKRSC
jgi:VIT family